MEQNLPFDLDALLVFGKVVESRSLSKAAALLGMPKSTVSRKLTKLESDLGIKLLRKNTHQLTVTDLGEKVYDHAVNILTEANGVRALVEGSKQEPQGELRVAIPVFVGIDYASRVGATFLQRYPHSRLDIRLVDNMVDPIKDGFDVVFGTGPLQDSTLIARKVFRPRAVPLRVTGLRASSWPNRSPIRRSWTPCPSSTSASAGHASSRWPRTSGATSCRHRCGRAPTTFRCASSTSCRGSASAPCPPRSSAPTNCATAASCLCCRSGSSEPLDVHMIYPFELSFSTLISAFYEAACEIIVENTARA